VYRLYPDILTDGVGMIYFSAFHSTAAGTIAITKTRLLWLLMCLNFQRLK